MRSCFEGASESRGGGRGCHGKLWGGTWPCGHLLQVRCRGDPWDPSPGEASRPPGSTRPCLGRRGQPLVRPPGAAQAHPLHRCPQPAAGEEQQHWQPPGQGGPGPPAPRLRLGLPGLPCPDGWHLQAEALQCGGARLLPGERGPRRGGHGWVWAPAQGVTGGHSPASSGLRAPEKAPWPSVRPPSAGVALASGRRLSGGALSQKAVGFHSHGTECTCPSAFGARWSEQKVEAWVLGVGSPWPPGVHGSLEVRAGLGRGCGWRCTALRGKLVGLEGQASGTLVCCGRVLGRAWGWGQGPKQGREGENAWKRAQVS